MTHSPDGGEPFRLSPDKAFTLLGNGTRIEILQALWETYDPHVDENADDARPALRTNHDRRPSSRIEDA